MVNTFILHPNLWVNSKLIDNTRLGKQRVEAMQILNTLQGSEKQGWCNHPAVKMWRGYEEFLKCYINSIITEWVNRGFDNNYPLIETINNPSKPWWWNKQAIHFTHQANLYLKMPHFYANTKARLNMKIPTIFDDEDIFNYYTQIGYIWPENMTPEQKQDFIEDNIRPCDVADPLTAHLINPRYCVGILSSGDRKGQYCHRILRNDDNYCGTHSLRK